MTNTTTIKEVINNLEKSRESLEEFVNSPSNYNTEFSFILSITSNEIRQKISHLREHAYMFGDI